MTRALILLFFYFGLLGQIYSQSLQGQIFLIGPSIDKEKCESQAYCDCCGYDVWFLDDKEFVMVSYCLYQDAYYPGTYIKTKDRLNLTFKQFFIAVTFQEGTNKQKEEKKKSKMDSMTFQIKSCGQGMILENPYLKELKYGSRRPTAVEQVTKDKLKKIKRIQTG